MDIEGRISYASQVPWIFSGTLKENILFNMPFNHDHYQAVLEACALVKVSK